jgi:hypothetical protein
MRPRQFAGGFLVGLVVSACVALPVPSSQPPPAGSPPPWARPSGATPPPVVATPEPATPTPPPTIPAEALARLATTDKDGVRVAIELERNPMPASEPTWVTTSVTNTGRDDLIWFHDGCVISVGVNGQLENARYRAGAALPVPFHVMKGYLLDVRAIRDGDIWVGFTPERFIGKGSIGCADIRISDRVRPGGSISQRAQWNGLGYLYGPPPPTGIVDLVGSFSYYWRKTTGEPEDITKQVIDVHLRTWVVGGTEALLDPGEAVDAALADPRLPQILARLELRNANEPFLRYDLATATYAIGVLVDGDPPQTTSTLHTTIVDAHTGDVIDFVERVWDWRAEGNP